ncbi:MAG: tRNA epoxyqueuosine(34) reductase QueG [Candidatus Sulfotelmatobacter sp.]
MNVSEIKNVVSRAAEKAGFDLSGIAPAGDARDLEHFPAWIAAGRAGEMKYMEARDDQGQLKRASLSRVASWAKSVIVCAINYNTAHPDSTQCNDPDRGWISRYAWGGEDYHDSVLRRLKRVEAKLHEVWNEHSERDAAGGQMGGGLSPRQAQGRLCPPVLTTRSYVDTGPIVERVFAKYAGIGWVGKNTCLINQKKGSWLFLGVILTSLEFEADLPAPDRCGSCTRCIEACPTDAILAPYQLDSNRCISYLTIEKRGTIPEELRAGMGRHVFGCDICQDVCPWNRKAPATDAPEFQSRPGLVNPALAWLAEITPEEFQDAFCGSPIRRARRAGLRRNAVVAMGNSGNKKLLPLLDKLTVDDDPTIAEAAEWASARLNSLK